MPLMLPQERTRCGCVHARRSKCTTRFELDSLLTTLIGASVGLLVDERIETEFVITSGTLVRQVTALYQRTIIGAPKLAFTSPVPRGSGATVVWLIHALQPGSAYQAPGWYGVQ